MGLKKCSFPGCGNLIEAGVWCPTHKPKRPDNRPNAQARGYGRKWQIARAEYLRLNPYCVECLKLGEEEEAKVVDHIKPHRGDQKLFWSRSNWQPLCKRHHDRKTAIYDSKFARRKGK